MQPILRALLLLLDGFQLRKSLCYRVVDRKILLGVSFGSSGFDKDVLLIDYFVQPLFVPKSHLVFNVGGRLRRPGGGDRWNTCDAGIMHGVLRAVVEQAVPFFESQGHLECLASLIHENGARDNVRRLERAIFANIDLGRTAVARELASRLIGAADPRITWQAEVAQRATAMAELAQVDLAVARKRLAEWSEATLAALKLS